MICLHDAIGAGRYLFSSFNHCIMLVHCMSVWCTLQCVQLVYVSLLTCLLLDLTSGQPGGGCELPTQEHPTSLQVQHLTVDTKR